MKKEVKSSFQAGKINLVLIFGFDYFQLQDLNLIQLGSTTELCITANLSQQLAPNNTKLVYLHWKHKVPHRRSFQSLRSKGTSLLVSPNLDAAAIDGRILKITFKFHLTREPSNIHSLISLSVQIQLSKCFFKTIFKSINQD